MLTPHVMMIQPSSSKERRVYYRYLFVYFFLRQRKKRIDVFLKLSKTDSLLLIRGFVFDFTIRYTLSLFVCISTGAGKQQNDGSTKHHQNSIHLTHRGLFNRRVIGPKQPRKVRERVETNLAFRDCVTRPGARGVDRFTGETETTSGER